MKNTKLNHVHEPKIFSCKHCFCLSECTNACFTNRTPGWNYIEVKGHVMEPRREPNLRVTGHVMEPGRELYLRVIGHVMETGREIY